MQTVQEADKACNILYQQVLPRVRNGKRGRVDDSEPRANGRSAGRLVVLIHEQMEADSRLIVLHVDKMAYYFSDSRRKICDIRVECTAERRYFLLDPILN